MSTCYRFLLCSVVAGMLSALLLSPVAMAGVELQARTVHYGEQAPRIESTITRALDGSLRIDVSPAAGSSSAEPGDSEPRLSTIFRGAFGDFLIVDHSEKAFTLLDESAIEDIEARLQFTMLQLDRKMAELPPEQRRRMRDALASQAPEAEAELVETQRRRQVSGLECQLFEFRRGDELVREVWVAPWDEVDGGDELRRSLEKLQVFSSRLEQAFASVRSEALGGVQVFEAGDNPFQDFERLGGLPVKTVEYEGGQKSFETEVEKIEQRQLSPRDFLPPESYRQRPWSGE